MKWLILLICLMIETDKWIKSINDKKNSTNDLSSLNIIVNYIELFNRSIIFCFYDLQLQSSVSQRTTGSEIFSRCSSSNDFLKLANIWSRLLKHNWWDLLYEKIRIHSDVFFDLTFNENSFIRIWISAHACVWSAIMIFISSFEIARFSLLSAEINRIEIINQRFFNTTNMKSLWMFCNMS